MRLCSFRRLHTLQRSLRAGFSRLQRSQRCVIVLPGKYSVLHQRMYPVISRLLQLDRGLCALHASAALSYE